MCLAVIALNARPDLPLFIAANRDEFHGRPAAPAAPWDGRPDIYGGRDLSAGGTWLAVARDGRWGLLTNYRDPSRILPGAPSRGALVQDYLTGGLAPADYAARVADRAGLYNGFNLLAGDLQGCAYLSNRSTQPVRMLASGVHGLSNHLLDTPWPKLVRVREAVRSLLDAGVPRIEDVLAVLADRRQAPDHALPETGVGIERERLLSSPFIAGAGYGTRCSTVVTVDAGGQARLYERSYDAEGRPAGDADWAFCLRA